MKKFSIGLLVIMLWSCSVKLLPLTQADAERAKDKFPESTLESLNEGKMLFEKHCGLCHNLKKPTSHSEAKWRVIVPKMVKNVNRKMKKEELDKHREDLILQYLVTMSKVKRR